MAYGPELTTDPQLLTPGKWNYNATFVTFLPAGGFFVNGNQSSSIIVFRLDAAPYVVGKEYRFIIQVSRQAGQWNLGFNGGGNNALTTESGLFAYKVTKLGGATTARFLGTADFVGTVSYFAIQEALPMALADQGFKLVVSMRDAGNDPSRVVFDLVAATHADAVTAAGTILTRLGNVTDLAVEGYSIVNNFLETAFALPSTGQAEERAKIVAAIDGSPNKKATIYIPGPVDSIFSAAAGNPGYNVVDVFDTNLDAYVDIWKTTGALATISDGENLADQEALSGKRTHRKSSSG